MTNTKHLPKLIVAVAVCELTGIVSTPFTANAIPTWYIYLNKPFFSPPNWIFAPVWTLLYLLMGIALYLVWKKEGQKKTVKMAMTYFAIQLALNFTWSLAFFGLRSPLAGLVNIIALLAFILLTTRAFAKISRLASYLLYPYILWVSFATLLNTAILLLN